MSLNILSPYEQHGNCEAPGGRRSFGSFRSSAHKALPHESWPRITLDVVVLNNVWNVFLELTYNISRARFNYDVLGINLVILGYPYMILTTFITTFRCQQINMNVYGMARACIMANLLISHTMELLKS